MHIDYSEMKRKVFNKLDLTIIAENVRNEEYHCYEKFLADIKWIAHNTKVHRTNFIGKALLVEATKWLIDLSSGEIESIRLCYECYFNANQKNFQSNWFVKPCTVPHLVVWAKLSGYPYWPAKLMSSTKDEAEVQFFGDHKRIKLKPKNCFIYSKKCPTIDSSDKHKLDASINVSFENNQFKIQHFLPNSFEVYLIRFNPKIVPNSSE